MEKEPASSDSLCHQSTTIILWVPLILMSVVEVVFSFRCVAACTSFLYLCPCRKRPNRIRRVSCSGILEGQKCFSH